MRRFCFPLVIAAMAACNPVQTGNIALNRMATASSNYDYNLTAQLLTDGIYLQGDPAFLEISSSEGPVDRIERENALDGDDNSRNIITGKDGWIEWRFNGYDVVADKAEVLYQEALAGGRGGPKNKVSVPVKVSETGALRIELTFPHEGRWRVKSVDFYKDGQPLGNLLPSAHFTSAWMSGGNTDEWVMVDLGGVRRIDSVRPHWVYVPDGYTVETSKDGRKWKPFRPGRWRYVRLIMHNASGDRFCLTELEVLGPVKKEIPESDWKVRRASEVADDGELVSSTEFDTQDWLPASVPGTTLANYIKAGAVPDPAFGDNWSQISDSFFNSDFWYRKEFDYKRNDDGRRPFLDFDGINWKADVWLNGVALGSIEGAFMRGHFDVGSVLKDGRNALAVKVRCNAHPGAVKEKNAQWTGYNGGVLGADNPTFHASIGWDWMTTVRGRNCGIWNDVRLVEKGPVELGDPLVVSKISPDGLASVTPSVIVKGLDAVQGQVQLVGWIGDIAFCKDITDGGEISFSPDDFPQLKDRGMDLWWPVGYGEAALYDAGFAVKVDGVLSDSIHFKAGIREVTWDDADGALKLYINGRRFVPQGGNWGFSEQNLMFGARDYDIALDYHRQMHFNMIRNWVGQIGDEEFYDSCDRYGVMVWQDFWLANPSDGPDPDDEGMFLSNAKDWVSRIRRHPCLALYCGRNEGNPPESLDKALRSDVVSRLHPGMLYISNSADGIVSGHGPYRAMPVEYYFSDQSGKLHSERGMPNIPVIESLRKMMPSEDLWPQGEMWGKHDFTRDGAQKATTYNALLSDTFGECASAEEYAALAQWLNYNGYRAIFESANSAGRMGLLLWMSHSCWPSLVFCPYDYYFQPSGGFFGCKKACEPLHIQYNPVSRMVEVVSIGEAAAGGEEKLVAKLTVCSMAGKPLYEKSAELNITEDSTQECFSVDAPSGESIYHLVLSLCSEDGRVLSDNTYTIGASADLRELRSLPSPKLSKTVKKLGGRAIEATICNEGDVPALMVRLKLTDHNGDEILPVDYSDNYFSLMPGERKKVVVRWRDGNYKNLEILSLSEASSSPHMARCSGAEA